MSNRSKKKNDSKGNSAGQNNAAAENSMEKETLSPGEKQIMNARAKAENQQKGKERKRENDRKDKGFMTILCSPRAIRSIILSLFMLFMAVMANSRPQSGESWYFPLAVFLAIFAGLFQYIRFRGKGWIKILYTAVFTVAAPFLAFVIVEFYNKGFWHVGASLSTAAAEPPYSMIILNYIVYALFFLLMSFLAGRLWLGYCIADCCFMVLAIVNFYVVRFRGSPLMPWDLLSIRTAGNVAGNYEYVIYWKLLFATFAFIYLILVCSKMSGRIRRLPVRLSGAAAAGLALVLLISSLQNMDTKKAWGVDTTLFTPNVRYTKNGLVVAYLVNLNLINIKKPDGYSPEKAVEIIEKDQEEHKGDAAAGSADGTGSTEKTDSTDTAVSTAGAEAFDLSKAPNIIVIVNEAFSDLSVIGDFRTTEDYMPFFRTMMEKYTSGHLMTSIKGGNTANTEYEFLSGDSMAFLPEGSVVFQQYISDEVPTLASYLHSLGYSSIGMHPYQGSGWDRDRVYPLMGFDKFYDQDYFKNPKYIRKYISDESAFDRIIQEFENKEEGEKKFIFEVTMQNHSGYSTNISTDNGFTQSVLFTDLPNKNTEIIAAERYLTLIKKSDEAYRKLISYFEENITEPTIIVTFGDHEPNDYVTDVVDNLVGFDPDAGVEESQKHYLVPFFIWNNFGMEKDENVDMMSMNYLASYILKSVGLPMTGYQEFLENMRSTLPVICAGTYIDAEGNYHDWNELGSDTVYGEMINNYNILTYNHLTDKKGRVPEIFNDALDESARAQQEAVREADEKAS